MMICRPPFLLLVLLVGSASLSGSPSASPVLHPKLVAGNFAPLPSTPLGVALGQISGNLMTAGGLDPAGQPSSAVLRFDEASGQWVPAGRLPAPRAFAAAASWPGGMLLVGGKDATGPTRSVLRLSLANGQISAEALPDLPFPVDGPLATLAGGNLYLAGTRPASTGQPEPVFLRLPVYRNLSFLQQILAGLGFDFPLAGQTWIALPPCPGEPLREARLVFSFETVHLFGLPPGPEPRPAGFGYHPAKGWRSLSPPPAWAPASVLAPLGESHQLAFVSSAGRSGQSPVFSYHTLTDAWAEIGSWSAPAAGDTHGVTVSDRIYLLSPAALQAITVIPPSSNFLWVDHLVVAVYLLVMVAMGAWFVRRESNSRDFFRAGQRVPWWAIGMSLFATAASAISLMTMPGKSFSSDWTFFTISIFSALTLPLSLFLLAPLIRRLGISTANEYLELRFGLVARMVGSVIYMVNQILARMGPIIYLPSIAMAAITGIDIWVWILVIGVVTTLYTFLGGLAAVIWTDTVQGFIMLATVAGCLLLLILKIDLPWSDIWPTLTAYDKLHTFDPGWDATQPAAVMIFIGTIFVTLLSIGDQNFVQRIQAAPSVRDAQRAVAMQMAVAVPINVLLFALGTALFLYYRAHPAELNPVMKTDGVYPFFAAQHLPVGVSGLVIAALLAATMSTVSSAICSVANLGLDDFYRRFVRVEKEVHALFLARFLSLLAGILGITGALFLARADNKYVWDVALIITSLVTNGTVGLFGLGLLTRRAHELGALLGICAGMGVAVYLQAFTPITFWLYAPIGSSVTFLVGYALSLALPGKPHHLAGLTVFTLDQPRPQL